jgi:hypothetical protein
MDIVIILMVVPKLVSFIQMLYLMDHCNFYSDIFL